MTFWKFFRIQNIKQNHQLRFSQSRIIRLVWGKTHDWRLTTDRSGLCPHVWVHRRDSLAWPLRGWDEWRDVRTSDVMYDLTTSWEIHYIKRYEEKGMKKGFHLFHRMKWHKWKLPNFWCFFFNHMMTLDVFPAQQIYSCWNRSRAEGPPQPRTIFHALHQTFDDLRCLAEVKTRPEIETWDEKSRSFNSQIDILPVCLCKDSWATTR